MITDKLEKIVAAQVDAVKNIKIDKVTVWDGNGQSENGKTSTANFVSGMLKSLPPLNDIYEMAGLKMPDLVSPKAATEQTPPAAAKEKDKK